MSYDRANLRTSEIDVLFLYHPVLQFHKAAIVYSFLLYFGIQYLSFGKLKSEKPSKKKASRSIWENPNIIAIESVITSIATIYYVSSILQFALFRVVFGKNVLLENDGVFISTSFPGQMDLSIVQQCLFILTPYLLSVVLIEVTNILVKRATKQTQKTFLLFTQLSLFSFFLFSLLLFVISLVFSVKIVDSWQNLMLQIKPDFQYKIIIALSVTIVFFGYFGSVLGRLKNYFSSQESNNT